MWWSETTRLDGSARKKKNEMKIKILTCIYVFKAVCMYKNKYLYGNKKTLFGAQNKFSLGCFFCVLKSDPNENLIFRKQQIFVQTDRRQDHNKYLLRFWTKICTPGTPYWRVPGVPGTLFGQIFAGQNRTSICRVQRHSGTTHICM